LKQEYRMTTSRIVQKGALGCALLLLAVLAQAAGPATPRKAVRAKAPRVVAPVVVADPVFEPLLLTDEDKAVVERVSLGTVPCELGASVMLTATPDQPGRFVLEHNKRRFHMVVTQTTTGAIRLEDAAQGAVWLQLANKSMLMDQKNGHRLADACMNAGQMQVAEAMERTPGPGLLDPLPVVTQAAIAAPGTGPAMVPVVANAGDGAAVVTQSAAK
jgi:hypothetical protein